MTFAVRRNVENPRLAAPLRANKDIKPSSVARVWSEMRLNDPVHSRPGYNYPPRPYVVTVIPGLYLNRYVLTPNSGYPKWSVTL